MNAALESRSLTLEPVDNTRLANLCGQLDEHLRQLEEGLDIEIRNRGNMFRLLGSQEATRNAAELIQQLYALTSTETLNPARLHLAIQESGMDAGGHAPPAFDGDDGSIQTRRVHIRPRGGNQRNYVNAIRKLDLCFGIGPAGTGKTYLAVACAVEALQRDLVRRLVLVRPAVEAGERLGFLPGDLSQKVDPYLRPIYDALYEMLGFDQTSKLIERNVIEVAPLAFMRGRTLNEAFVILDEAQNTTAEQMKMFLTRIGFGTKAVVTGDVTQVDLPRHKRSGLRQAREILATTEGIHFQDFVARDVVRHSLVQRIVEAYAEASAEADEDSAE